MATNIAELTVLLSVVVAASSWPASRVEAREGSTIDHHTMPQTGGARRFDGIPGHPTEELLSTMGLGGTPVEDATFVALPFPPVEDAAPAATLVNGPWINFEVPIHKGMALHPAGGRLYFTHEANNSVGIIDLTTDRMRLQGQIPVGLGAVTIRFQPDSPYLWVAQYVSDNVLVIDTTRDQVVDVIEVGDRPVNVLFNSDGSAAFVVCEGSPADRDDDPGAPAGIVQDGALVALSTTPGSRSILRSRWLNCNTPRAAIFDPVTETIVIAARDSGNNTTVVGEPIRFFMDVVPPVNPDGPDFSEWHPILMVAKVTSGLSGVWSSSQLSPWPENHLPLPGGELPDKVHRIVTDAGHIPDLDAAPWQAVVDYFLLPDGTLNPAAVEDFKESWEAFYAAGGDPPMFPTFGLPITLLNAEAIVQTLVDDAKNTIDHDLIYVDVSSIDGADGMAVSHVGGVGEQLLGLAMHPTDETLVLTNLKPHNLRRLSSTLRGDIVDDELIRVDSFRTAPTVAVKRDLHDQIPDFEDVSAPNAAAQAGSVANPLDVVFRNDGDRVFVTAFAVGRVASVDLEGQVRGIRDVGGLHSGPRSLEINAATNELFVFDRLNMTITRLDGSTDVLPVLDELCIWNPEPPRIRTGRKFLYSARFSNNYSSSCATCHPNGHMDKIAWELGDAEAPDVLFFPHTMSAGDICEPNEAHYNHAIKGPMVTQSLRGLNGRDPFHWRGDKQQFVDFNEAFVSLLGAQQELSDADMQRYSDFIMTVAYQPTYFRHRNNTFKDPIAIAAIQPFNNFCAPCHQPEDDGSARELCQTGDIALDVFGGGLFAQVQLVTQLRGINEKFPNDLYTGFGLIHDGREERNAFSHPIEQFLFQFFPGLWQTGLTDAFVMLLSSWQSNVMPCVGEQFIWNDTSSASQNSRLDAMVHQHRLNPSRCDVVLSGHSGAGQIGYYLTAVQPEIQFRSDLDQILTLTEIKDLIDGGASFLVTAVPPGSGKRIGIDWDSDCRSNGLDSNPLLSEGDPNQDGKVNIADLNIVLGNFGKSQATLEQGDLTGDKNVFLDDLNQVIGNFGAGCAGSVSTP